MSDQTTVPTVDEIQPADDGSGFPYAPDPPRNRYTCNHPKVDDSGICEICRAAEMTEGTHIRFISTGVREGQKTERWDVETKEDEDLLGKVKWFCRWRQYAFFPAPGCVFEQTCMREISDFIEEIMRARKAA